VERNEHWRAFGPEWFRRHQAWLLWGLNTPGLSTIVRGLLRIRMSDVWMPRGTRIWEIRPNSYTVRLPTGEFRTDFRTHWKYAKRVYYAWKPLWWAMHGWDAAFADRWAPAYSFGFLTLTAYPDPDPETTTVDGRVVRAVAEESWATLIAGAGNLAQPSSSPQTILNITAGTSSDLWTTNVRAIYLFDTSSLDDASVISAAIFSILGTDKDDPSTAIAPNIDVYTSTPASNTNLVNGDYGQTGAISQTGAPISYANWSTSAYNDFTFNATGRGNISLTGVSKFATKNANYDAGASGPTWSSGTVHYLQGASAEATGTTSDPKLVVTYTVGAAQWASAAAMMGIG